MSQWEKLLWLKVRLRMKRTIEECYFPGQFKLRLPKSLHRSLAEHSKREGISMNQYCVYLLAKNDGAAM